MPATTTTAGTLEHPGDVPVCAYGEDVPYGVNAAGRQLNVKQVARGRACGLVCDSCGRPLVARHGKLRPWRLAHAAQSGGGRKESHWHRGVKRALARASNAPGGLHLRVAGKTDACPRERWKESMGAWDGEFGALHLYFASNEQTLRLVGKTHRRPDVWAAERNAGGDWRYAAIEVAMAHPKDPRFVLDMALSGIRAYEYMPDWAALRTYVGQRRAAGEGFDDALTLYVQGAAVMRLWPRDEWDTPVAMPGLSGNALLDCAAQRLRSGDRDGFLAALLRVNPTRDTQVIRLARAVALLGWKSESERIMRSGGGLDLSATHNGNPCRWHQSWPGVCVGAERGCIAPSDLVTGARLPRRAKELPPPKINKGSYPIGNVHCAS